MAAPDRSAMLAEFDALVETNGRLMFAKKDFNEAEADAFGIRLLDFFNRYAIDLRAGITASNLQEAAAAPTPFQLPFDETVQNILGRPCFTLIEISAALRRAGMTIRNRAEDEQAACLHWMLNLYLRHGSEWARFGSKELNAAFAGVRQ